MNILEVVDNINEKISIEGDYCLAYIKHGYVEAIQLNIYMDDVNVEIDLWNDQDDSRNFDEVKNEYEDFEIFLKRKINEIIDKFKILKDRL